MFKNKFTIEMNAPPQWTTNRVNWSLSFCGIISQFRTELCLWNGDLPIERFIRFDLIESNSSFVVWMIGLSSWSSHKWTALCGEVVVAAEGTAMAVQDSSCSVAEGTSPSLMRDGEFVILKTEKAARLVQLSARHPVFVDKRKIECRNIIGHEWEQVSEHFYNVQW